MRTRSNNNNSADIDEQGFQVIAPSKPDYRTQKVACVYCGSIMKWLLGMPEGHGQWLCENCGAAAYQGYGDTPDHHSTDPDSKLIVSPNDPYPTGVMGMDAGLGKAIFKDAPFHELDLELDEEFDELKPGPGRPRIRNVSDSRGGDMKRRYGLFHDIRTAEEASGLI
jgi:hypothetical protein